MDRRNLRSVLLHAAAIAGRSPASTEADRDLLRRFAKERDEAAFAELVRRYGRLVWAVCRQLLPADTDAEDAFQATFLALVRSAGSVRDGAKLGPWLHGVAFRVCSKLNRAATRRKRREESVGAVEARREVPDSSWDAALAVVHEEVARLPESLRVPFVLCCLEGKGATEAANQLGWKLGTLSGRLTRAKQTLLARLEARGLSAATVAAVAVAGGVAIAGVPAAVAGRAVDLIQPDVTISSSILHLSQGVVGMSVHRTKLFVAALMVSGGLASAVGSGWLSESFAQQPKPGKPSDPTAKPIDSKSLEQLRLQQQELLRAIEALRKQEVEVEAVQKKTALEALANAAEKKKAGSKWEYNFLSLSGIEPPKFVDFLNAQESEGWEFVSEVTLKSAGKDVSLWLFRRPAGGLKKVSDYGATRKKVADTLTDKFDLLKQSEMKAQLEAEAAKLDAEKFKYLRDLQDKTKEAAKAEAARQKIPAAASAREKALMEEIERLRADIEKLQGGLKVKPLFEKVKPDPDKTKPLGEKVKPGTDKVKPLGEKIKPTDEAEGAYKDAIKLYYEALKKNQAGEGADKDAIKKYIEAARKQAGEKAPTKKPEPEKE